MDRKLTHQEAWDLIPWYINNSVTPEDRKALEVHLSGCEICRREVEVQMRIAHSMITTRPSDIRADASWRALEGRLSRFSRISTMIAQPWAAGTLAAACLGAFIYIGSVPTSPLSGEFTTLTTATDGEGVFLRIRPTPGVGTERLANVFLQAGLGAIPPVSETGLIRVAVPAKGDVDRILAILENAPEIAFVAGGS